MSAAGRLRHNRVFASMPDELLAELLAASTLRRYQTGERVLSDGDPADRVFVLERGAARVFHASTEGLEVLIKGFRAPAIFGEAEAMAGGVYVENVDVAEPSEIVEIPVGVLLDVLRRDARAATEMLIDVATRLGIASANQKSIAFDPITVRLANYLVEVARWTNPPDAQTLRLELTQDDMAAAIGATRRSVAKDVMAWQEEGILERRAGHYLVRDVAALERFADRNRPHLHYTLERRTRPRR